MESVIYELAESSPHIISSLSTSVLRYHLRLPSSRLHWFNQHNYVWWKYNLWSFLLRNVLHSCL